MCLFGSRVVAENDFLHTLLNKVTALRGDSGGQGTVLTGFALCFLVCKPCDYPAVSAPVCTEGSQWTVYAAVICGQTKWPSLIASSPHLSTPWVRMKVIILMDSVRP